jgi:hypothetical protein
MKMYTCKIKDKAILYCFGKENNINNLIQFINYQGPHVSIEEVVNRIKIEKIYIYPESQKLSGRKYIKLVNKILKNTDLLINNDELHSLMFLSNPNKMQQLLGFTDEEAILYKEELGKIYHVDE